VNNQNKLALAMKNATRGASQFLAGSVALSALILGASASFAQVTTGAITGSVNGASGGETVTLTDTSRNISRSVQVNVDGSFAFKSLPPGQYEVVVIQNGNNVDVETVSVRLDSETLVNLATSQAGVEELIVLGSTRLAIETSIAESGLIVDAGALTELPVPRNFDSVALLAPGTTIGDTAFGTNVSFSGSSVAENTSYINGLNTTNFRNGLGYSQVPFEFYDTLQVKTGGYSAAFGRSTGGVLNARSKSGSNDFQFGVNAYYDKLIETSPNTFAADNGQDESSSTTYDIWASGPIIPDRLFYYALYSDVNSADEYYGVQSGRGYKYSLGQDFWGVKLDGYLSDNHRIEVTAFTDERTGIEGAYEYDSDTKQTGAFVGDTFYERGGMNWIATYTGQLTDNLVFSASTGENEAARTTNPATASSPVLYEVTAENGFVILGDWTEFTIDVGEDKRESNRFDLTYTLNDHTIRVGYDEETNNSVSSTINSGGVYWLLHPTNDYGPYVCDVATECPSGADARRRTYNNGGSFDVESKAYYIEDTWQFNDDITLEIGLRNDEFVNYNAEGKEFVALDNQWAPRVSALWQPSNMPDYQFFANFGRYYLPVAANTNIRLAGGETYIQEYFDWDGVSKNADGTPQVKGGSFRTQTYSTGAVPDTRGLVDQNLEAMYQNEIILGGQMIADNGITWGAKYIYRDLATSIEDVAIDAAVIKYYSGSWPEVADVFTGFHQYVLANPGNPMTVYIPEQSEFITLSSDQLNYPKASRTYHAFEITMDRPFDGKWGLSGSYTWAHSYGNNEGYVRSDNGQDDAGLTTNFDQPGLTEYGSGNLPNDRRHTVKFWGTYQMDNGIRFGANFMAQTGRPIACFGVHPTDEFAAAYDNASFYCDGQPVPRASRGTTSTWWNLDLNAQYTIDMRNAQLVLSADIFNIFNTQKIREVSEDDTPFYGLPTGFQPPRSLRVSARYRFF